MNSESPSQSEYYRKKPNERETQIGPKKPTKQNKDQRVQCQVHGMRTNRVPLPTIITVAKLRNSLFRHAVAIF